MAMFDQQSTLTTNGPPSHHNSIEPSTVQFAANKKQGVQLTTPPSLQIHQETANVPGLVHNRPGTSLLKNARVGNSKCHPPEHVIQNFNHCSYESSCEDANRTLPV